MDTRFLLAQWAPIRSDVDQLTEELEDLRTEREERTFDRLYELQRACSTETRWAVYITAIDYGSRPLRSQNAVFGRQGRSGRFLDPLSENLATLGLLSTISPREAIDDFASEFPARRLLLSAPNIQCVEECYKRHNDSTEVRRCLRDCLRR